MIDSLLHLNSKMWFVSLLMMFSLKHCLFFKKKGYKNGPSKFQPSNDYSSVVQTSSNQHLQKLFNLELQFKRYCNLKYMNNKTSVKSTALQILNCAGQKKHTLATKTTPKANGTYIVPGNLYCNQTTHAPWQGVDFCTNTVLHD